MQGQQPRMVPPQAQAMKPVPSTNTFKTQDLEKLRIAFQDEDTFKTERLAELKSQPYPVGTLAGIEIDRRTRMRLMDSAVKAGVPRTVADQNMEQLAYDDMRKKLAANEGMGVPNIINQMEQGRPPLPSKMLAASGGVVEGYNKDGLVEDPIQKARREAREKTLKSLGIEPTTPFGDMFREIGEDFRGIRSYVGENLNPFRERISGAYGKDLKKLEDYKREQFRLADEEYERKQKDPRAAEFFPDRSDTGALDRAIQLGEITVGPEESAKEGIGSLAPGQTRAALQSIKLDRLPVPEAEDYLARKRALEEKLGIGNLSEEVLAQGRERLAKDKDLARLAGLSALTDSGVANERKSLLGTGASVIKAVTKNLALEKGAERKAERAFENLELAEKRREDAEKKGNVKEIIAAEDNLKKRQLETQKVNIDIAAKEEQLRNEARKAMSTELYRRELGKYYQAMASKNSGAMTQKDFLDAEKGFLDVLVDLLGTGALGEDAVNKLSRVIVDQASRGGGTPQIGTRETR